jgi:hypothetical protein
LAVHGTGAEDRCNNPKALSVGLGVRTGTTWLVSGELDLLVSQEVICELSLPTAQYNGESVTVWGFTNFALAPQITGRVGRRLDLSQGSLTPGLALGLLRASTNFTTGTAESWTLWYGSWLAYQPGAARVTIQLDVGRHRVPRRYYAFPGGDLRRQFSVGSSFTRLGVAIPLL